MSFKVAGSHRISVFSHFLLFFFLGDDASARLEKIDPQKSASRLFFLLPIETAGDFSPGQDLLCRRCLFIATGRQGTKL
jgi:hypothetical protein